MRGPDVVAAAQAGDTQAKALMTLLGRRLGVGIANAINTFDPEVVVIGGGVATAGDLLLGPARESARRLVVPGVGEATEIRLARYGADAGVRGAALLADHELDADDPATVPALRSAARHGPIGGRGRCEEMAKTDAGPPLAFSPLREQYAASAFRPAGSFVRRSCPASG